MVPFFTYASLLTLALLTVASVTGPVIKPNFPDPAVLKVGNELYAYSTTSGGKNIPWARSTNEGLNWTVGTTDALPNVGSWGNGGRNTWAPHAIDRGDGTYILYYAAESPSQGTHCVGAASSSSPSGPFNPGTSPIGCQTAKGGSIDPSGFQDVDGTRYVVYKVDGNSLGGGGGVCNNADGRHPTPILLQKLQGDGLTPAGDPVQILDRSTEDGALVEAPNIVHQDGVYFLFFSSHCYLTSNYDIRYATATKLMGPYTKATNPLKATGDNGLNAPGGLSVLPSNNSFAVFHATSNTNPLTRPMYIAEITYNGNSASA